ncbi:Aldo/keto reductase [Aureobasidium pullulans]|uniref:Aldo/keto reductase n=1 Tax=Aureobasidium pullulans TaxID=5580 RepID=A0A4S9USI1_AURPU|nr:Aldo/keto reductase [Aureobasidium pullulans]THY77676.1 Aldo/keto reductase [Aureobasidium pullulans]THZ41007.1 Aldo/keto reductase [Aureobasidium pullulans]THZ67353.1 Aldo/keto reductase [Aureobasidium pullulans]THZ97865.1 Aldo/keto reductase [Aureobasidium pullulans]
MFESPPKPTNPLAYHRILSPSAAVKVSPLCLGGISIGESWSGHFGKNEDALTLLDTFFELGGNFIDTSNVYNSGESETLIGDWMQKRDTRDQMVIATKYSAGYMGHMREQKPMQANYTGNSAKSMYVSVRDSLAKLKTEYIDILYVHWWDFGTSVEEVMRHLHTLVMARQVLYLGISDTPAWIVVKANAFARQHGLTPFSVYQGKWNAGMRDMEAELIPMCEDEGLAIVPWAALGQGQLLTKAQRKERANDPDARQGYHGNEQTIKISAACEEIAKLKNTTLQAVALAYLFAQSTYVFPIVGVQTVEHVKAMPDALRITLTPEEIAKIQDAAPFDPLFPMSFL